MRCQWTQQLSTFSPRTGRTSRPLTPCDDVLTVQPQTSDCRMKLLLSVKYLDTECDKLLYLSCRTEHWSLKHESNRQNQHERLTSSTFGGTKTLHEESGAFKPNTWSSSTWKLSPQFEVKMNFKKPSGEKKVMWHDGNLQNSCWLDTTVRLLVPLQKKRWPFFSWVHSDRTLKEFQLPASFISNVATLCFDCDRKTAAGEAALFAASLQIII